MNESMFYSCYSCRWDPERYERGEDKKEQWAFLGWGVGMYPLLDKLPSTHLLTYSFSMHRPSPLPWHALCQTRSEDHSCDVPHAI